MKKKPTAATTEEIVIAKRPKQNEMPIKGDGVEVTTDKELIAMGDKFIDQRDAKAQLTTELTKTEADILKRMAVLNLQRFRFGDQLAVLSTGKQHVKIKTVKNEGVGDGDTNAITEA